MEGGPAVAGEALAVGEDDEELGVWVGGGEGGGRGWGEEAEGGGQGTGGGGVGGDDGGAGDGVCGEGRSGVDDVGVVVAEDIEAAAVVAAGGDGGVGDDDGVERGGVFCVGERVGDGDGFGGAAADDDVTAAVEDEGVWVGGVHGGVCGHGEDVAFGEGVEEEGGAIESGGGGVGWVEGPVGAGGVGGGGGEGGRGGERLGFFCVEPEGGSGGGGWIEGTVGAVVPCIEEGEEREEFRGDGRGLADGGGEPF